jgi:hypothetical protein
MASQFACVQALGKQLPAELISISHLMGRNDMLRSQSCM